MKGDLNVTHETNEFDSESGVKGVDSVVESLSMDAMQKLKKAARNKIWHTSQDLINLRNSLEDLSDEDKAKFFEDNLESMGFDEVVESLLMIKDSLQEDNDARDAILKAKKELHDKYNKENESMISLINDSVVAMMTGTGRTLAGGIERRTAIRPGRDGCKLVNKKEVPEEYMVEGPKQVNTAKAKADVLAGKKVAGFEFVKAKPVLVKR